MGYSCGKLVVYRGVGKGVGYDPSEGFAVAVGFSVIEGKGVGYTPGVGLRVGAEVVGFCDGERVGGGVVGLEVGALGGSVGPWVMAWPFPSVQKPSEQTPPSHMAPFSTGWRLSPWDRHPANRHWSSPSTLRRPSRQP